MPDNNIGKYAHRISEKTIEKMRTALWFHLKDHHGFTDTQKGHVLALYDEVMNELFKVKSKTRTLPERMVWLKEKKGVTFKHLAALFKTNESSISNIYHRIKKAGF